MFAQSIAIYTQLTLNLYFAVKNALMSLFSAVKIIVILITVYKKQLAYITNKLIIDNQYGFFCK